ncbi:hypothetical protein [Dactylosporangium sp. CS-033363]|uniref:hypothetical protein n=1 Tax=Dactylosporangium sp. CS-033363 TaxID=3239935 RepID=UPI003D936FC2
MRQGLSWKQQAAVEYGVGALAGGVTRLLFGREVVEAARVAFAEAPDAFPAHLAVPVTDDGADSNQALAQHRRALRWERRAGQGAEHRAAGDHHPKLKRVTDRSRRGIGVLDCLLWGSYRRAG